MCIYNIYLNNILASIYTHNYFNNNFILATICTLCEAPESNTIDSGAIQIHIIIIIIIMCPCGLKTRYSVLSTLLYGPEAWTVYRRQVKKLHAFMMRHLRSIMRITWMDKVTNKEILERTGLPSMEDLLIRKNLRWTGHLMKMSPDRLPKQVLYSQLSSGRRKSGRPRLRFKDTIKRNLKMRAIKIDS